MAGMRTDLAMERTAEVHGSGNGVSVERHKNGKMETTWVHIMNAAAAERFGKPRGSYWTMMHPELPMLEPEERMGRLQNRTCAV